MVIKPIVHLHTQVLSLGIILGQFGQHVDLQLSCLSVLLDVLDDFDGKNFVLLEILTLDYFAKSSFTKFSMNLVPSQDINTL